MGGSVYVQPAEYAAYGLAGSTAASDVASASALVDAALKRPEGLVWAPDANGWPCYMAALDPTMTFTAAGGVPVGTNVVVAVTGGMASPDLEGDVLVLDRATSAKTEAAVVTAVGQGTVTLDRVTIAHSAGVTLDAGLTILEERGLPANRSVTRVSRSPVARMLAVQGRYAYGRRSQQQAGVIAEPSILTAVQVFGGPPVWNPVDVNHVSVSQGSGEVWIPAGALVATFSDVRMRYVAGYRQAAIPDAVKRAVAGVVLQLQDHPELSGSIKSVQAGGSKVERFADTLLDVQTLAQLEPFKARLWY